MKDSSIALVFVTAACFLLLVAYMAEFKGNRHLFSEHSNQEYQEVLRHSRDYFVFENDFIDAARILVEDKKVCTMKEIYEHGGFKMSWYYWSSWKPFYYVRCGPHQEKWYVGIDRLGAVDIRQLP